MLKIFFLENNKQFSYNHFFIIKSKSLQLELALNKSDKGHEWKSVGDKLYNFYISNLQNDELLVNEEQYNYLKNLLNKINNT